MTATKHPRRDRMGRKLRVGHVVRVLGVPDLSGIDPAGRRECEPVFRHIVGTYKKVAGFDEFGHVELEFKIRKGSFAGYHSVWIEPDLLRIRGSSTV